MNPQQGYAIYGDDTVDIRSLSSSVRNCRVHHETYRESSWNWTPACDYTFNLLKSLVPKMLQPLDWSKVKSGEEKVCLFTNTSIFGCGGWLGQGKMKDSVRPFQLYSAKFNPTQKNYSTTDQELLAVLSSVVKFQDHLIG